jgi:Transposase DDE domain
MNQHTPFFPFWRAWLGPMGSRLAHTARTVGAYTLCQLEERFAPHLPADLFPKAAAKANSRDRVYTRLRTFWCLLWQGFNPKASGREVVRQLQALFHLQGGPSVSEQDGAYCRAKGRLPLKDFPKALSATAQAADRLAPALTLLQGRPVKVADGSTLTAPDTRKNRRRYPPVQTPEPNFPMLRLMVFFSLVSGAILSVAIGDLRTAELPMLYQMFSLLAPKDILMGDRGFGNFVLLALLAHFKSGVDFIGRSARQVDGRRRLKRLGKDDWLVAWKKGTNPSLWLPAPLWALLPKEITVRIVRGSCYVKGFRVRRVTLVTTLLDAERYPASEILQAYLRRWRLEMCLDDLKTTLEMEMLRGRSPNMLQKEIYAHLIAHNLIRCVMAQAAAEHAVPLERISFKGTLDTVRQFTQAMSQARTKKKRSELWDKLLETLANDLVPERPGRREPRAIKRVKNKYPRLSRPRHIFRDRPKRNVRRTISRMRKQGLK